MLDRHFWLPQNPAPRFCSLTPELPWVVWGGAADAAYFWIEGDDLWENLGVQPGKEPGHPMTGQLCHANQKPQKPLRVFEDVVTPVDVCWDAERGFDANPP